MQLRPLKTIALVAIFLTCACGSGYKEMTIAKGLVITPEWKEINPENALRIDREYQYIRISVAESFDAFGGKGIKTPNGDVVNPEINLIGDGGDEVFPLEYVGSDRGPFGTFVNYGSAKQLPKNLEIRKVMIRSDITIQTDELRWSVFDWRDVNTK